ncbi:TPA: hypothetical protein DEP21_06245 [Patescibacteria group bacterium]|nr:hypothetical protein [Candidatus Gracilibacteria bacterium]
MDPNTNIFNNVATVNMQNETYSYTANRNGEFIFQFSPNNGGKQVNYTVMMNGVSTSPKVTPTITKVPKTGPTENIIAVILISLVFYFGYKKFYKKAR